MNKKTLRLVIASACIVMSSFANAELPKTVKLTSGDWEPFVGKNTYRNGYINHIVIESFKKVGIEAKLDFFPWKRSWTLAKKGEEWVGLSIWWLTPEVKKDFEYSVPVMETSYVFFHLKTKEFNWSKFSDLKGLNVGLTREYAYGKEFDAANEKKVFKSQVANKDELNFKKLLSGRIDIFPQDPIVGMAQIRNNFPVAVREKFTYHSKRFERSPGVLIISKKVPKAKEIIAAFNKGYEMIKADGTVDRFTKALDAGKYDNKSKKP